MSLREVLEVMPYRLRSRFESLGAYVQTCIDQTIDELRRNRASSGRRRLLSAGNRQTIQMIAFVVGVARFFKDGTRAASLASDACQSLNAAGFTIGNTLFEGRNANVMMGLQLRNQLLEALGDDEIEQWADSTEPLGQIIRLLVMRAANE